MIVYLLIKLYSYSYLYIVAPTASKSLPMKSCLKPPRQLKSPSVALSAPEVKPKTPESTLPQKPTGGSKLRSPTYG